jgi:hypothetical protein
MTTELPGFTTFQRRVVPDKRRTHELQQKDRFHLRVWASTAGDDLRHFQQQVREPRRLIDHHVMARIVVDENLPTAAGFAIGQCLVERGLRIFRRAYAGLLGNRVALAG